jgi:HK97 family phage prohead protease
MKTMEMKKLYAFTIKNIHPLKEKGTFRGYASTTTLDKTNDVVALGAFSETLRQWKVKKNGFPNIYEEHDPHHFIGTCKDLQEDGSGLYIEGKLFIDDIPRANHVYQALIKGEKCGLSIGFYVVSAVNQGGVRTITKLDLVEVSIVTYPCNGEAKIHEFKTDHDPTKDSLILQMHQLIECLKKGL